MAGYSKGIVDTRKLNKDSKAKLGRGGDTEIRKVDGKKSHVNALEAYLIDVNGKAGEEYAKRVGAGTINPLTGMPEYHGAWGIGKGKHPRHHKLSEVVASTVNPIAAYEMYTGNETGINTLGELIADPSKKMIDTGQISENLGLTTEEDPGLFQGTGGGKKSYDELQAMTPEERATYQQEEFGIGAGYEQYMTGFQEEPFGFLGEQKDITMEALGRTTRGGLKSARQGRDTAASRSGLATSGTITQAYESQKKDLFQDYRAGTKAAGLDFRQAEYLEKQRQEDQYYDDLGMISGRM
tara:strand:- start:276 stop:1163 length:888 start_codon:yes stop_codon:yes gene_type:complete